tara:strand:+ start:96 stop:290 length:195 start_codon:yes stop_codon:yes gene_type:complete
LEDIQLATLSKQFLTLNHGLKVKPSESNSSLSTKSAFQIIKPRFVLDLLLPGIRNFTLLLQKYY